MVVRCKGDSALKSMNIFATALDGHTGEDQTKQTESSSCAGLEKLNAKPKITFPECQQDTTTFAFKTTPDVVLNEEYGVGDDTVSVLFQ